MALTSNAAGWGLSFGVGYAIGRTVAGLRGRVGVRLSGGGDLDAPRVRDIGDETDPGRSLRERRAWYADNDDGKPLAPESGEKPSFGTLGDEDQILPGTPRNLSVGYDKIDPQEVRFSQDSCGYRFKNGGTIDDLVEGLRAGRIQPEDVPPIRLMERAGKLFTLDNRRLEAFRRAGVEVPYRMATQQEIASEGWKFTTQNEGISIRVRGESQ